jgi:hypothetical protein
MTYMLISGAITDRCLNTIVAVSESKYGLEKYAQEYVEQNPGTQLHIFSWEVGFESKPAVTTERLWHSGFVPSESIEIPTAEALNNDPTQ